MNSSAQTALAPTSILDMLGHIKEIESLSEILALIKKIDALKVALEAVDTFHSQSIMYAKLEATALVQVVDIGGFDGLHKLREPHKSTASWLSDLSEQDRERYILMCEDGLTIDQVYKREVGDAKRLDSKLNSIDFEKRYLIERYNEDGIVDMKRFSDMVRDKLSWKHQQLALDIIDGTRNKLRKMGAVGLGDGSGIYVSKNANNSEEIKTAIIMRCKSIYNDIESINEISSASGVRISVKDFSSNDEWEAPIYGDIFENLLSFLCASGVICD